MANKSQAFENILVHSLFFNSKLNVWGGFLQLYRMNVIESVPGDQAMKTAACLLSMFYCRQNSFHNRYTIFLFWYLVDVAI